MAEVMRTEFGRNRRTKRMAIYWPTTLVDGDRRCPCTIVDVSRSGARIQLTEPVKANSRITLLDDRVGQLEALVKWCRGDMCGVEFLQPTPEVSTKLRAVLAALEEVATGSAGPQRQRPQFGRRTHHGTPYK
jgi:hypothetical protein